MVQPETRLVTRIRKAIVREYPDTYVLKVHGGRYQPMGTPDLLVLVRGRLFGLEVKHPRPGETPAKSRSRTTEHQRDVLHRIVRAGGYGTTVLSSAEALAVVARGLRECHATRYNR